MVVWVGGSRNGHGQTYWSLQVRNEVDRHCKQSEQVTDCKIWVGLTVREAFPSSISGP